MERTSGTYYIGTIEATGTEHLLWLKMADPPLYSTLLLLIKIVAVSVVVTIFALIVVINSIVLMIMFINVVIIVIIIKITTYISMKYYNLASSDSWKYYNPTGYSYLKTIIKITATLTTIIVRTMIIITTIKQEITITLTATIFINNNNVE